MSQVLFANIIRFILLVPIQVLVLDNINLGGYINPYLYVLFILMLPFEIPGWALLFLSFMTGLTIDMFSGTPGMHAAASTLIAYLRPMVARRVGDNREIEPGMQPSIMSMGFSWFFMYSLILVFVHHFALFLIEVFRFSGIFSILLRTLYSTLFTLTLIILVQYLFGRQSRK
jgi:rod shape-determining protein MreD